MRLTHSTLASSPDENGNKHRLDIEPKGKNENHVVTYSAHLFSYSRDKGDPRHDQKAIAKFSAKTSHSDNKEWVLSELHIVKDANDLAKKFNIVLNQGLSKCGKITFVVPQFVNLDDVSWRDKSRRKGEFCLFEDKLSRFQHFLDASGRVCPTHCKRKKSNLQCLPKVQIPSPRSRSSSTEEAIPAQNLDQLFQMLSLPDDSQCLASRVQDEDSRPPTYEESQAQYGFPVNPHMSFHFAPHYHSTPDFVNSCIPLVQPPSFMNNDCSRPNSVSNGHLLPSCPVMNSECNQSPLSNEHVFIQSNSCDDQDQVDFRSIPRDLLQAFIHYYFCHTNGERVICNLKGSCEDGNCYTLTMPTIHSASQSFGARDMGVDGIFEVIGNHKCSQLCSHLRPMNKVFEEYLQSHAY